MSKLIIANWKSNHNLQTAQAWVNQVLPAVAEAKAELVVAPPFSLLAPATGLLANSNFSLAVQDLSSFKAGSYTGAVCATNLVGLKIKYAILGHSERRRHFHETDEEVAAKVKQALVAGINPIICVDEPYLASQHQALVQAGVDFAQSNLTVAYEPLAAIGTGQSADLGQVSQVISKIKELFGPVAVVYGGSVEAANIRDYLEISDGVLVGSASLQGESFVELVQQV